MSSSPPPPPPSAAADQATPSDDQAPAAITDPSLDAAKHTVEPRTQTKLGEASSGAKKASPSEVPAPVDPPAQQAFKEANPPIDAASPLTVTTGTAPVPSTEGASLSSPAVPPPIIHSPTPTPASSLPPPAAPSSATPSRDASPSSTTSSTRPSASGTAPPVKKFSSLNVNKKFLETALQTTSKESVKDSASLAKSALATGPPAKVPTPTPHPPSRLLTTRPVPAPSTAPRPTATPPSQWGAARPGSASVAMAPRGSRDAGAAPWSTESAREAGAGGPSWRNLQANFPTTKESLEDRQNAALLAAQNAAEANKAAAAHEKAIAQELDSFRGSHLDPNAHHWDEPEEDDDDFLDEVVDFGDGKKYTISASPQEPSFAAEVLAKRESIVAAENAKLQPAKSDFDRSWPQGRAPPPAHHPPPHSSADAHSRVLFNERNNRFEQSSKDSQPSTLNKNRRLSNDPPHGIGRTHPSHLPAHPPPPSNPNLVNLPPSRTAWGIARDATGKVIPPAPASRALPPHLASAPSPALPAPAPAPTSIQVAPPARPSAIPPRSGGLGVPRSALGEKRGLASARGSVVDSKSPSSSLPPPPAAVPTAPSSPSVADRRLSHDGPRPAVPLASSAPPQAVVSPVPVTDITELQKDEMHTAAERAKQRRQKEEEERAAAQERARQKAKELEAKFGPAPSKSASEAKSAVKTTDILKKPVPAKVSPPLLSSSAPKTHGLPINAAQGPRVDKVLHAPVPVKVPAPVVLTPTLPSATLSLLPTEKPPPQRTTLAGAAPTLQQLLAGSKHEEETQDVDFGDLSNLLEGDENDQQTTASTVSQAAPTSTSRRPAAADFFDRPSTSSTGPVLPPPVARSEATSSWRKQSSPEVAHVGQTSAPENLPIASPPQVEAVSSATNSPEVRSSVLPAAKSGHKEVSVHSLDDVMLRIKGAMNRPKPTSQPSSRSPLPSALAPAPVLELPEPESPFTQLPCPPSPSPVWKKFTVKINADTRRRAPIPYKQTKIDSARETLRAIDPLSWTPSLYKWLNSATLSRDDYLNTPAPRRVLGRFVPKSAPVVQLPTKTIADLPVNPPPESPVFETATIVKLPPSSTPALGVIPPTPGRVSRSGQESTWRRAAQPMGPVDPSAAPGGPIRSAAETGNQSSFAALNVPDAAGAPIVRLRTPPIKGGSSPKLPRGSVVGFYRGRTPSLGAASDEQMASMVRFTVSSELVEGPGGLEGAFDEEDVPSFPSLMRPSSVASAANSSFGHDQSLDSNSRLSAISAASALSPPSAATSDAWSKTPMAYSPSDRTVLPSIYGGQHGAPAHTLWGAAPSPLDLSSPSTAGQFASSSPNTGHLNPQMGLRGQDNPYQQPPRYQSPAMGYALPTSSPQPTSSGNTPIYTSSLSGAAPRFQPGGQHQQPYPSSRPDPSARPFIPHTSGGHPGLARSTSSDVGSMYPGHNSSPMSGSPYSPGVSLPGLPPAVQGGVWVPISMPMSGRNDSYQSSPSASPLPTPYYTPQPNYQQLRPNSSNTSSHQPGNPNQSRFRNLSEFSTSSPVFTPLHQQHGAFSGTNSPFEVRPQASTPSQAKDTSTHPLHQSAVRAPIFTPSGAGGFGRGGPW